MRTVVASLGAAALLSGCAGSGGSAPGSTTPPTTGAGSPTADLSVVVVHAPSQPEQHWTLRCSGSTPLPGSTHPTAAAACALIAAHHEVLFPPTPSPQQACSMLYGGPDVATVTGTDDGAPVARRFSRTNGCETEAWNAAVALIGSPANAD